MEETVERFKWLGLGLLKMPLKVRLRRRGEEKRVEMAQWVGRPVVNRSGMVSHIDKIVVVCAIIRSHNRPIFPKL